jgi:RNA polymerase sigma-70 factor (ECF subfamily)
MALSDFDLVEICNHGTAADAEQAFNTLYQRHKAYVIRVAMRYVSDHDIALDALQETFTYLLRKFPPSGKGLTLTSQLTTLLYPVAKNNAITLLRKSTRFPGNPDQEPDDLPAHEVSEPGAITELLADLPVERREVVLLRFVDDMSLQEIADALQIPLGTVKSRLHLAIRQLRDSPAIKNLHFP